MKRLSTIALSATLAATSVSFACNTSQPNCVGKAKFQAPADHGLACVIWKQKGARGFTNFTLQPNQVTWYIVGYGDVYMCAPIQLGTPRFEKGYRYINVWQ